MVKKKTSEQEIKRQSKHIVEDVEGFIKKYPISTTIGVAIIGFALGNLFSKRKR